MGKEAEKFLQAEETAVNLVNTLTNLNKETTSYQTAKKELDVVRQRLIEFIESTKQAAENSYEIIKILKDIGGPEILTRITAVENKTIEEFGKQKDDINEFRFKLEEEFSIQKDNIDKLKSQLEDKFSTQFNYMKKIKILISMVLTSSIIAICLGLIILFYQ